MEAKGPALTILYSYSLVLKSLVLLPSLLILPRLVQRLCLRLELVLD